VIADVSAITSRTLIEPHRSPSVRLFFIARSCAIVAAMTQSRGEKRTGRAGANHFDMVK